VRCEYVRRGTFILKGGNLIDLWYLRSDGKRICVGCGRYKQTDLTIVHNFNKLETYIVMVVEFLFQQFQNLKLLFPNPYGIFVGDSMD
jgi:hypothetical protein